MKNDVFLKFSHLRSTCELAIESKVAPSQLNLVKYDYRVLSNFSTAGESGIYDNHYSRGVYVKGKIFGYL